MSEYALRVINISKTFNNKKAVKGITFALPKGKILGLLGPNGAGKSTTIRMIMNIIAPDYGDIEVLGKNFSEKIKDRISYLPEERGLYRKMKVMDTLYFLGKLKGMGKREINRKGEAWLTKFSLYEYKNKKIEELSKGMAQKLQIISTIINEPELLILDEPFSGLDPVNIELVKDLIIELKEKGTSIIFSTHLMAYAEKIVDNVVMINKGQKVIDGTLADIKKNEGKRFVNIKYEGDSSFISELEYIKSFNNYGQEIEVELNDISNMDKLLKDIAGKISISYFKLQEPSLNNIFMRKVNEKAVEAE